MNVFIILSILVIIIGVLLLVATPSVLFKLNWNVYVLQHFGIYNKYNLLDYKMKKLLKIIDTNPYLKQCL